ncbi:MAG: hypothetical protein DHS20C18_53050 [Saprospiraceae bacterium]|nr:MAG: hypothetical protein DHS20C18_53050 [Saprospiraceae bacterium]
MQPEETPPLEKLDSVLTYWGVHNVPEMYQQLLAQDAQAHEGPTEVGGGIIVATVKDPWGNVLGIIDNPHFRMNGKGAR